MTESTHNKHTPGHLFTKYIRSYRSFLVMCLLIFAVTAFIVAYRWDTIQSWYAGHRASAPVFSLSCAIISVIAFTIPIQLWLLYKKLHSILQNRSKRNQ